LLVRLVYQIDGMRFAEPRSVAENRSSHSLSCYPDDLAADSVFSHETVCFFLHLRQLYGAQSEWRIRHEQRRRPVDASRAQLQRGSEKKSVRSLDETVSTTVDRYAECAKTYAVSHFAEVGLPKIS
jgi:hypothetical protein